MKRIILLPMIMGIIGLMGIVLVGCNLDDENDCTSQSNTFTIVGYNGLVAKGGDELIFGGADGEFAVIGSDFNTTYDSLMIIYQAFVAPFVSDARETKGSFISGAYAECIPQPIQMVNFIDSVYITSDQDYTTALPAGADLAGLFTVRQFNEDVGFLAEAVRIPEFLAQNRAIRGTSYEIYRPAVAPSVDKEHIFTITVKHLNEREYTFSTPKIIFP